MIGFNLRDLQHQGQINSELTDQKTKQKKEEEE